MNKDKMAQWIVSHTAGFSSKAMWAALMGVKPCHRVFPRLNVPYDAGDFSCCHDLVKFCEVSPSEDFPKILQILPWYAPILDKWAVLSEMFEDRNYRGVNILLRKLLRECQSIKNGNNPKIQ